MAYYHAVLEDECGEEFGAGVEANSRQEAWELLRENYPESRIVQLESPDDRTWRNYELSGGENDY